MAILVIFSNLDSGKFREDIVYIQFFCFSSSEVEKYIFFNSRVKYKTHQNMPERYKIKCSSCMMF